MRKIISKKDIKALWLLLRPSAGTIIVFGGYTLLCFYSVLYAWYFKERASITAFEFTIMFALASIINALVDIKKYLYKS
jgi:hypothetical protein